MKCIYSCISLFIVVLFFSCTAEKNTQPLHLAAASNLQYVVEPLTEAYQGTLATPIEIEISLGSSGKLSTQIIEGAPYDVFLGADQRSCSNIVAQKYNKGDCKTYAVGELVLWTLEEKENLQLNIIELDSILHFAIPNPRVAPYGEAAVEALNNLKWYDTVKDKLVYGENVSQTTQYILNKNAQLGFISKSMILGKELKQKGSWTSISKDMYAPIRQDAVLIRRLKGQSYHPHAKTFYDFLFSQKGKDILKAYGYSIPQ